MGASIAAIAAIIGGLINFYTETTATLLPISATQTAEARLTAIAFNTFAVQATTTASTRIGTGAVLFTPASPTSRVNEERVVEGASMVFVPAGEFTMGSNDGYNDEKPPHLVYLDAFWIDKYEVTNALYKKCVDVGKCRAPSQSRS